MKEENTEDIKIFEAPSSYKFIFKFPEYSLLALVALAMVFGICIYQGAIKVHENTKDILTAIMTISVVLFVIFLITLPATWRIKRARNIIKLIINSKKKEVQASLDGHKVINFRIEDIKEVCVSPDMVRFFLKDNTWVTWTIDPTNQRILEDAIVFFGVPIMRKKYIW